MDHPSAVTTDRAPHAQCLRERPAHRLGYAARPCCCPDRWRHLTPTDEASLVTLPTGEKRVSEVAVTLSDAEGDRICIRSPISAREVSKLLQVFSDAGSPVVFSAEHEFLLALDAKDVVL